MRRRSPRLPLGLAVALVLVGAFVFGPSASATQPECKAINQTQDVAYHSNHYANPLGTAISEADSGDTIKVIGTCYGSFIIDKDLTLIGRPSATPDRFPAENEDIIDGGFSPITLMVNAHLTVSNLKITGGKYDVISSGPSASLTIKDSVVRGSIYGEGIYSDHSTVVIEHSSVSLNPGSGIANVAGTVTITDSVVGGNNTFGITAGSPNGGGIYNTGTVTIENSRILANTASNGGGIYNTGTVAVASSTIESNTASTRGGGIYNTGTVTIDDSTIVDNNAPNGGGGVFNDGALTINDATLTYNIGGAVSGGWNATTLTVTSSTISENSGGISASAGLVSVSNTLVTRNTGTGIGNFGSATVTIEDSTISENTSSNYPAIYNSLATMTIRDSVVSDNTATGTTSFPGNGGAIGTRGHLSIENSTVSGNEAMLGGKGGGIYRLMISNLVITGSVITGNTATEGGAIYPVTMDGVTLNGTNNLCGNTPDDWFGCLP